MECSYDDQLYAFTCRAKTWCQQRGLDLNIKPLSLNGIGMGKTKTCFPELTSTIKASRARNLLAFVAHFAVEVVSCHHFIH